MSKDKPEGDSLYWVVDRLCGEAAYKVAASHAKRGNRAVILTNRKPIGQPALEQDHGDDIASRITEISTK